MAEKKIVTFIVNGEKLPLYDWGDGMYLTIVPDANTGVYFGFTEEYLTIAGATRLETDEVGAR